MATSKKAKPKPKAKPIGKLKSSRTIGRPTKLDGECQERFIEAVREGLPYSTACALANIADSTWANWRHRAEAEPDSPYFAFLQAVKAAEAEAEQANLTRIRKAADNGQWQASAWILERRHPDKWGRTERQEQTHNGQVEIVIRREKNPTKTD